MLTTNRLSSPQHGAPLHRCILCVLLYAAFAVMLPAESSARQPNLLLIIADDLGYGDLGCTGSKSISTRNIDHLAASGLFCNQAYVASPVCSPSRAGLMTGRDPRRFGYEGNLNASPDAYPTRPDLLGLPTSELTLADHLNAAGYATSLIGKWHLGDARQFHPNQRGFDYFCGMLNGGHDYFPTSDKSRIERNGSRVTEFSSDYLTDFFTDEALGWIKTQHEADPESPWLLVLSYNAPHTPMQAKKEDLKLYHHIKDKKRRTYAAMVHALDRGVGRVMRELADKGLADNTLTVFLSDNGGATNNASWNGPLSGAKGTLLEGGVRVPMIWNWPAKLTAGAESSQVISSLDLLPTFLAAAQAKPLAPTQPPSYEDRRNRQRGIERFGFYDGVNQLPYLAGEAAVRGPLFWRLQGQAAVLNGQHKLIRLSHRPAQLFAPADDPGEQKELSASAPGEYHKLFRLLGEWEATLPTVPLWDSSPFWWGDSAQIYDTYAPRSEPTVSVP